MAEFINQKVDKELSPLNNMGKPIPADSRQRAYECCQEIGLNKARAMECVSGMAEQLERDKPYEAQGHGMKFLDLTGSYRVMAELLSF